MTSFLSLLFGIGLGILVSAVTNASFVNSLFINCGTQLIGVAIDGWIKKERE